MHLKGLLVACATVLLLLAPAASARKLDPELLAQAEASMIVTGRIDIAPDGSVDGFDLDRAGELPDYIVGFIGDTVPGWRFEPVLQHGKPVHARATMTLRLLGTPIDGGSLKISMKGATFGEGGDPAVPRSQRMKPPAYPAGALRSNVQGDVYLLLKVDLAGKVEEVAVEQVNLRTIVVGRRAENFRKQLAAAAVGAARRWRFTETAPGDVPDRGYWTFRLPVTYSLGGVPQPRYGQWQPYFPGERHPRPEWVGGDDEGGSADALVAGHPHAIGTGPKLLTPLAEG